MRLCVASVVLAVACSSPSGTAPSPAPKPKPAPRDAPPASADHDREIEQIDLSFDVSERTASATIHVVPSESDGGLTVEIGNLGISSVRDSVGDLKFSDRGKLLDIGVPANTKTITVKYRYGFELQLNGALPTGSTFTWPEACGNLFPCRSAPKYGSRYTLELTGVPKGKVAIYPKRIGIPVPAYAVSWAVGDVTYNELGKTEAGTEIGFWAPATEAQSYKWGTNNLVKAVDWVERNVGPYQFGERMGPVHVSWPREATYQTMEHHPFWHMTSDLATNENEHIHQAIHGWFGNAVRIRCWEDFLISEGTTTYLTARATEAVMGESTANSLWERYASSFDKAIAWPEGCTNAEVVKGMIQTTAPYYKGAFFYRALEARIGRKVFDAALAKFYQNSVGKAVGVADLLDHFEAETNYDPRACADEWLREEHAPVERVCP